MRSLWLLVAVLGMSGCGPSADEIARANSEQAQRDHIKQLHAKDSEPLDSFCLDARWRVREQPYSYGTKTIFALVSDKTGEVYAEFDRWENDEFYHGGGKDWISADAAAKALTPKECHQKPKELP